MQESQQSTLSVNFIKFGGKFWNITIWFHHLFGVCGKFWNFRNVLFCVFWKGVSTLGCLFRPNLFSGLKTNYFVAHCVNIQGGSTKFRQLFQSFYFELYIQERDLQYGDGRAIFPAFRICTILKSVASNKV